MRGVPLFEIATSYQYALDELTDTDLPETVVQDTLEALQGEVKEKAINVAAYFRNLEETAAAIKREEQKMKLRREIIERRANWLKQYLQRNMEKTGINRIECAYFIISLGNNPPATDITDADAIPDEYKEVETVTKIDKLAIRKALKEGKSVPGARLVDSQRVDIK